MLTAPHPDLLELLVRVRPLLGDGAVGHIRRRRFDPMTGTATAPASAE